MAESCSAPTWALFAHTTSAGDTMTADRRGRQRPVKASATPGTERPALYEGRPSAGNQDGWARRRWLQAEQCRLRSLPLFGGLRGAHAGALLPAEVEDVVPDFQAFALACLRQECSGDLEGDRDKGSILREYG